MGGEIREGEFRLSPSIGSMAVAVVMCSIWKEFQRPAWCAFLHALTFLWVAIVVEEEDVQAMSVRS